MGRVTKKWANTKNAFCHPTLPDDEICIVTPPKGCPFSKPGDCWLLKKTLCGLHRSPRHWCQTLCKALTKIGSKPCDHDLCICAAVTPDGETICVGAHVDDVIHHGMNDKAELWFEQQLKECMTADFVGAVSWCLGICCEWSRTKDNQLSVHLSQEAQVQKPFDWEQMEDHIAALTPHRRGTPIDRTSHDGVPPENKPRLIKRCQPVLGGRVWPSTNTRPDMTVAVSPLATHIKNPSKGHLDSARHMLRCLRGSADWGIRCTSPDPNAVDLNESRLRGEVQWPVEEPPTVEARNFVTHTDSNWGPQDASEPKAGKNAQRRRVPIFRRSCNHVHGRPS